MPTMIILSILLVVLFVGIIIWRTKELPESVSAMVYDLPQGGWQWLWTMWLILVDVFAFGPVIEILDVQGFGWLAFLPMAMIGFVAVWPLFDEEHRAWHYALSIAAAMITQVCVWKISPWCLLLWLLLLVLCVYAFFAKTYPSWLKGKSVLIAECICYLTLILAEVLY